MKRIESLDSLRGIAALIVVFHHCAMTLPGARDWLFATYILRPLVIGPTAVNVFFVLSGMVLFMTFAEKDAFRYRPYLIKRVARIYLPLVAAILLSLLLYLAVRPAPVAGLSIWFNTTSWHQTPTVKLVAGHLLLIDPWRYSSLDNAMWSLVHEMRISIIFPLLALALRWRMWTTLVLTLLLSWAAAEAVSAGVRVPVIDPLPTIGYLILFSAGGAMAIHRERLARWFAGPVGRRVGLVLLPLGVILLCSEDAPAAASLVDIGAVLTVLCCFAVPAIARALSHSALLWLGKVSYSLYLLHLLVLLTLFHTLHGAVPTVALLAAVPVLSLLLAELGFRWIERPAMLLGRRLAAIDLPRRGGASGATAGGGAGA